MKQKIDVLFKNKDFFMYLHTKNQLPPQNCKFFLANINTAAKLLAHPQLNRRLN